MSLILPIFDLHRSFRLFAICWIQICQSVEMQVDPSQVDPSHRHTVLSYANVQAGGRKHQLHIKTSQPAGELRTFLLWGHHCIRIQHQDRRHRFEGTHSYMSCSWSGLNWECSLMQLLDFHRLMNICTFSVNWPFKRCSAVQDFRLLKQREAFKNRAIYSFDS